MKANNRAAVAAGVMALLVSACGGGGGAGGGGGGGANGPDLTAPTATLSVAAGELGKNQAIVVRFSESMDVASLKLGGGIGSKAVASWSSSQSTPNATLTLTPPEGGWESGPIQLSVDAADKAGNALATVSASYDSRLVFGLFPNAVAVVGHPDFNGGMSNDGRATAADTLSYPLGSAVAGDGTFFVVDSGNNRVLAYDGVPTSNGAAAKFVLGQPGFDTSAAGTGQNRFFLPAHVSSAGGKLLVPEVNNSRVLIYKSTPTDRYALPDVVLGQKDFLGNGSSCSDDGLSGPNSAFLTPNGKVVVADTGHHRVLVWNAIPNDPGTPADLVLGQADFVHCAPNDLNQDGVKDSRPTAKTFWSPADVWSDGQRLVVSDLENNRVLIWNSFPQASFQEADLVVGQGTFNVGEYNDDDQVGQPGRLPTIRTLHGPYGVNSDGHQLTIADVNNNRILVWNTFPTRNFQPADAIIGQKDASGFQGNDSDGDGQSETNTSANVFYQVRRALIHRDSLIVNDAGNQRVLVFKSR